MSYPRRNSVTVTTDASGDATSYIADEDGGGIRGKIILIRYVKDDYAAGVDFTITTETTGVTVWTESNVNASETVHPTTLTQSDVGADATARDFIRLAHERLKIVIAQGGDTKSGTFTLVWE